MDGINGINSGNSLRYIERAASLDNKEANKVKAEVSVVKIINQDNKSIAEMMIAQETKKPGPA